MEKQTMILSLILGTILLALVAKSFAGVFNRETEPLSLLPYLADAHAYTHEVVKISGYPANDARYIKRNNSFIIATKLRFESWTNLWRINADGIITDSFVATDEGEGRLPCSGIYFHKESYIDWALSGDKLPKSYVNIIDTTVLDKAKIHKALEQAQQIVWQKNTHYKRIYRGLEETVEFHYFLKSDEGWSLLKSPLELDKNEYPELSLAFNNIYTKISADTGSDISVLENKTVDLMSAISPIRLLKFKKHGRSKSGFMDINSVAWTGDYGSGHFQLKAGEDMIDFKSFHRVLLSPGKSGATTQQPDMYFYDTDKITDTTKTPLFLVLATGTEPTRSEIELGTYIIRKKISDTIEAKLTTPEREYVSASNQVFPLSISFKDFSGVTPDLYRLTYFNGASETLQQANPLGIAVASRGLPMEVGIRFALPKPTDKDGKKVEKHRSFILKINNHYLKWEDFINGPTLAMHFDFDEMYSAYHNLSPDNLDSSLPMDLSFNAEFANKGLEIRTLLTRGNKSIPIKKIRLASVGDHRIEKNEAAFIFDKKFMNEIKILKEQSDIAVKDVTKIPEVLTLIRDTIHGSEYPENFNLMAIDISDTLLNTAISVNNAQLQVDVIKNYVENLLPETGIYVNPMRFVKRIADLAEYNRDEALMADISRAFFGETTTIDYVDSQFLLEPGMLDYSFRYAMFSSAYTYDYLWLSTQVTKNNINLKQLATTLATHYTGLLITAIKSENSKLAETISKTYMDKIYPVTGYSEKSTDVISNIIVAGMLTKNESLSSQAITQFVNNMDYKLTENKLLYFNIACYYALHGNKERMLEAITASIQYGQDKKAFLSDSDFSAFKNDPEFAATVNAAVALKGFQH